MIQAANSEQIRERLQLVIRVAATGAVTIVESGDPNDQAYQRRCERDSQNNNTGLNLVLMLLGRHRLALVRSARRRAAIDRAIRRRV